MYTYSVWVAYKELGEADTENSSTEKKGPMEPTLLSSKTNNSAVCLEEFSTLALGVSRFDIPHRTDSQVSVACSLPNQRG